MQSLQNTCPHFVDQSWSISSRQTLHCSLSLTQTSPLCNVAVPSTAFFLCSGLTLLLFVEVRSTIVGFGLILAGTTGSSIVLVKSTFAPSDAVVGEEVRSRMIGLASCEWAPVVCIVEAIATVRLSGLIKYIVWDVRSRRNVVSVHWRPTAVENRVWRWGLNKICFNKSTNNVLTYAC